MVNYVLLVFGLLGSALDISMEAFMRPRFLTTHESYLLDGRRVMNITNFGPINAQQEPHQDTQL